MAAKKTPAKKMPAKKAPARRRMSQPEEPGKGRSPGAPPSASSGRGGGASSGGKGSTRVASSWQEANARYESMKSPEMKRFNATFESKLKIAQNRIMASGNDPKVAAAESDKLMKWVNDQSKKRGSK